VATQLTGDRRTGEGTEGDAEGGIESLDRLEHAEASDLKQVVDGLATSSESQRLSPGEIEVRLDQLVAQPLISGSVVFAERLERFR
jgi:hypothetical protein